MYGPPGAWKSGAESNFIGKFNPKRKDSDQVPPMDGESDPDGAGFNNTAERAGHSDPTDTTSTPEVGGSRGVEPPIEDGLPEEPEEEEPPAIEPEAAPEVQVQAEVRKRESISKPADEVKISWV